MDTYYIHIRGGNRGKYVKKKKKTRISMLWRVPSLFSFCNACMLYETTHWSGFKPALPDSVWTKKGSVKASRCWCDKTESLFKRAWGSLGIDSLMEPASSGYLRNFSVWHFSAGLIFQPWRLLVGTTPTFCIYEKN